MVQRLEVAVRAVAAAVFVEFATTTLISAAIDPVRFACCRLDGLTPVAVNVSDIIVVRTFTPSPMKVTQFFED